MPKRRRHRQRKKAASEAPAPKPGPPKAGGLASPDGAARQQEGLSLEMLTTPAQVNQMISDLLHPGRTLPMIVASTRSQGTSSFFDIGRIQRETAGIAHFVMLENGPATRHLSANLARSLGVWGGAIRVFPPGVSPDTPAQKAPLVLCSEPTEAPQATARVIDTVMNIAPVSASHLSTNTQLVTTAFFEGQVEMVISDELALIRLSDEGIVQLVPEELLPGAQVPVGTLVVTQQHVSGLYNPANRHVVRLDDLVPMEILQDRLVVGSVIPARIHNREGEIWKVEPLPGVFCRIQAPPGVAEDATTVAAEVLESGSQVRLGLPDPEAEMAVAPALMLGGSPWLSLVPPPPPEAVTEPSPEPSEWSEHPIDADPHVLLEGVHAALHRLEGSIDRNFDYVQELEDANAQLAAEAARVPELADTVRTLRLDLRDAMEAVAAAGQRVASSEQSKLTAEDQLKANEELVNRLRGQIDAAENSRSGTAPTNLPTRGDDPALQRSWFTGKEFRDPQQQLRFEVQVAWARGVPAEQKAEFPLRDYILGPDFLRSLAEKTERVPRTRVVHVIAQIVCGRSRSPEAPFVDKLFRAGPSSTHRVITRADGSVARRAYLQSGGAAARRLHYWLAPDSTVELANIEYHDDIRIH